MNRAFTFVAIAVLITAVSGCVTVEKVVKDRVDQNIDGNAGFVEGQGEITQNPNKKATREFIDIRVEIPGMGGSSQEPVKREKPKSTYTPAPTSDNSSDGNAGFLEGSKTPEAEIEYQPEIKEEPMYEADAPTTIETKGPVYYTVKDGDTLGHISLAHYDTSTKWTLIYEANMDKIQDPKKLKPGTVLLIPGLSEESDFIK